MFNRTSRSPENSENQYAIVPDSPGRAIDWYSLDTYAREVENGLPSVKKLLDDRVECRAYYDLDARRYRTQRNAEQTFDWVNRVYRQSGITHQCVNILCEHLYSPGPSRQFDVEAGEEFLERVWTDNHFDSLMQEADKISTLNDVCALQIDAALGNFDEKPITIRLWGAEEFWAWTDPLESTRVVALVTIDRFNETTTYRLWNAEEVRVYRTEQNGRVAYYQKAESSRHDYGELPFEFVHYEFPHRHFWTVGIGHHLARAEEVINDDMSLMKEAKDKYLAPICLAYGVPPEWRPVIEPGRWLKMPGSERTPTATGSFEKSAGSELKYLQAKLELEEGWKDITLFLNQVLESAQIPKSAVRMEQDTARSGVAIIAEQIPLLNRARKRRRPFQIYESQIARKILLCAGNYYDDPALVQAAHEGTLTLGWSDPSIPFPSVDRNEIYKGEIEMGVRSRLQIIQEVYGCDRDRALAILEQIAQDKKDEDRLLPMLEVLPATNDGENQNQNETDAERKARREEEGEL